MIQSKKRILWEITPATALSLAVMLFAVCFGWLLPPEYGQENGAVENLQILVLSLAAGIAFSVCFTLQLRQQRRKLYALSGVFLLLAIARELSWGRVFYMDNAGNIPPLKALWYGPAVYPVVAILITGVLIYFFTSGLHKELISWLKKDNLPLLDLVFMITGILAADFIEHHTAGLLGNRTVVFEELFELAAYCSVLAFMVNIVFNSKFHSTGAPKP
ncbi:hypothetical protein [Sporomusa termitida]|uniref:Uncharacterized protein n=1 Tax=Sporomusa termitida TaxID=2377 RepID=A0A517DXR4_9FIRM|nr:hypothetical protein [Sporomusa termitida]QDR82036.1 hypothetical protein SPTER_34570 [Sporomusa termitida]